MPILTGGVKGDQWPSILDGERTDRGWEHSLEMWWEWNVANGDAVKLRFIVPPRETMIVEFASWNWSGAVAGPTWTSAALVRELSHGQVRTFLPAPASDWTPNAALKTRTLYTIPGTDEEAGEVKRSQIEPHLCGLPAGASWGFNWLNNSIVAAELDLLLVHLQVIRIPVGKVRAWTEKDLANALTRIDEMGTRVS